MIALSGGFQRLSGQVYEWVDATGDRHFETSLDQVPPEQLPQARVVVSAHPSSGADSAPDTNAAAPAQPDDEQRARDDSFASGWDAGFRAGWDAGYRASADEQPVCSDQPNLVVLESRPPVVVNAPTFDSTGVFYRPPFDGSLTVPFDDGASFGLTGRSQMQQRRTLERGW